MNYSINFYVGNVDKFNELITINIIILTSNFSLSNDYLQGLAQPVKLLPFQSFCELANWSLFTSVKHVHYIWYD